MTRQFLTKYVGKASRDLSDYEATNFQFIEPEKLQSGNTTIHFYIIEDNALTPLKMVWGVQTAITVDVVQFTGRHNLILDVYVDFDEMALNIGLYQPLAYALFRSTKRRMTNPVFSVNNIPEFDDPDGFTPKLPNNLSTTLYRYQQADIIWMQKVEHMITHNIPFSQRSRYTPVVVPEDLVDEYPEAQFTHSGDKVLYVDAEHPDTYSMFFASPSEESKITFSTRGAMLGNEVGTGKTLTILSLINSTSMNTINDPVVHIDGETRYASRATLVVCSSHLCEQWKEETKKHFPTSWKVVLIVDKRSHRKYSYKNIIKADLVIVSSAFLVGSYYKEFLVPRGSVHGKIPHTCVQFRKAALSSHSRTTRCSNVCFEMVYWNRIVLDEAHESLSTRRRGQSSDTLVYSMTSNIMEHLHSRFRWAVSGTIDLQTTETVAAMAHFLQITSVSSNLVFNHLTEQWEHETNTTEAYRNILKSKEFIDVKKMMFDYMFMRRTVDQVKAEIDLPNLIERQVLVQLTDIERRLYDHKAIEKTHPNVLLQMCCHPLIAPTNVAEDNTNNAPSIITLTELSKILLGKHVEELTKLMDLQMKLEEDFDVITSKTQDLKDVIASGTLSDHVLQTLKGTLLSREQDLRTNQQQMNTISAKIERVEHLVNYLRQVTKRIREDPKCLICLGEDETIHGVTKCGHSFCYACIDECIAKTGRCPACRQTLRVGDITKVTSVEEAAPMEDEGEEETKDDNTTIVISGSEELREMYGAKSAAVIEFIQSQMNGSSRFILFSEWDKELKYLSTVLHRQNINNKWARGNVAVRNKAVRDFNSGACKVLMLSFNYMASGLDLSKADHVLFLGPLSKGQNVATIEQQAIGRALRAGQTKQVQLIRFITKDTIEQDYDQMRSTCT